MTQQNRNVPLRAWVPLLLGFLAFLCVAVRLDSSREVSWTADGPGLTFDENLNTISGVYVTESIITAGLAALDPRTINEIFNAPSYHPDYPPLGRVPLSLTNALCARFGGLGDHQFYMITYARLGSAICYGLTIWLIAGFTARHAGTAAGAIAGISLLLTPRVFGHAHLACVETPMNLAYAGCVCGWIQLLGKDSPPAARPAILSGILLGLALLTKIQAIFLPPVVTLWLLWNWRRQGIVPLLIIAVTSGLVFLIGWPWLWNDPVGRFFKYFSQSVDRPTLYCYYLGERFADQSVPWHYPFVQFLMTTPLPWLVLGGWGMWSTLRRSAGNSDSKVTASATTSLSPGGLTFRQNQLLLGAFFLPLIAFALPRTPVYDGERLFLVVWPIFAVWTGIGGARLWTWLELRTALPVRGVLACLVLLGPLVNLYSMSPVWLSAYGLQSGGLWGANQVGMERNYWGDAASSEFLKEACQEIPEGSVVGIAPVVHPAFPQFLKSDSWLVHRPDIVLVPFDERQPDAPRYVIHIKREADTWKSLESPPEGTRTLAQMVRQGVVLAEALQLPPLSESSVSPTETTGGSQPN